jgi:beta-glucosidase
VGNVLPNSRLGIPPINMNDGPQGFRDDNHPGSTTAWPSGLTIAASWDVAAMKEWGVGMGKEFYGKGSNVQLGPGLCLARVPLNGRNFEYLSGEDPFLGYTLVQPVITGIQSQKVVANAKHYVLNNQETSRDHVSAEVDERTRFEMYYPPFVGAAAADVGSVMCSYNKINGLWSCENPTTLAHDLKQVTGFKGYVMSDWGATHSTSIMAGLDMEMPAADSMNPEKIKAGLASGNITQAAIDDAIFRILRAMFAVGVMDEPASAWDWAKLKENVTTADSVASARRLSAQSTVLLKNNKAVLPLPQNKKIAIIGFGKEGAVIHGGGSGSVVASFISTPFDGISAQAGSGAIISFSNGTDLDEATSIAKAADYAVVFVGTVSSEGSDRKSLSLDDGCNVHSGEHQCEGNNQKQNAMVSAIAQANPNTIVVLSVPGAILMPWSNAVAAILTNFMPGQQAGNAIADVLFGAVNPSARLPLTFPNKENETAFSPSSYPGWPDVKNPTYVNYTEKLLVGYRYYDANRITFSTGFPFGHGLSYTTFDYSQLTCSHLLCSFLVKNTGKVPGQEVAQLYLKFPDEAKEPPFQLKGFVKTTMLSPGESTTVSIQLHANDVSIWDDQQHKWAVIPGTYGAFVGASSRDLRLSTTLGLSSF